jgi:predicted XRE-type DNA-binding protein
MNGNNPHIGSSFDDFLEEEGLSAEVEAVALKRVIAWQIEKAMKEKNMTKAAMAKAMNTSRSQLDRLLDPDNESLTLSTLSSAARALGKPIEFRLE